MITFDDHIEQDYDNHIWFENKLGDLCRTNSSMNCKECIRILQHGEYELYVDHHKTVHTDIHNVYRAYDAFLCNYGGYYKNQDELDSELQQNHLLFTEQLINEKIVDPDNIPDVVLIDFFSRNTTQYEHDMISLLLRYISRERFSKSKIMIDVLGSYGPVEETLKLVNNMLDAGISVSIKDANDDTRTNSTIFLLAITFLSTDLITRLLDEFSCDINEVDGDGNNALNILMISYRFVKDPDEIDKLCNFMLFLMNKGINITQTNVHGLTSIDIANYFGWTDVLDAIDRTELSNDIIDRFKELYEPDVDLSHCFRYDSLNESDYQFINDLKLYLIDHLYPNRYTKNIEIIQLNVDYLMYQFGQLREHLATLEYTHTIRKIFDTIICGSNTYNCMFGYNVYGNAIWHVVKSIYESIRSNK